MKLAEEVLAALAKHEGLTAPELLEHCPEAEGNTIDMGSAIAQLRQENRIHWNGELRDQRQVYVVGAKPAQPIAAARAAPEPNEPPTHDPVAPAPSAIHQEKPMTLRDRIEATLKKHGPMTVPQIRKHVKAANLSSVMSLLARQGVLGILGGGQRSRIYGLSDQKPPIGDAPPQHRHKHKTPRLEKRAKKPGRKPGPKPSAPAPSARPAAPLGNGAAQFAINAHGELGIEKDAAKVRLEPGEFEALRHFIDQTKSVWSH